MDAVLGRIPDWPAEAWADLAVERRRELVGGNGQRMPSSIDTALLLFASHLVSQSDPDLARELMSQAVESAPGDPRLIRLEELASDETEPHVVIDVSAYLRGEDDWVVVSDEGTEVSPWTGEPQGDVSSS